tara:strand:- start:37 stop:267 length:231 start_codon:yes stop_codon:yes gene_type:complete
MNNLPDEIINKVLLYAISTPSAECIKNVDSYQWRMLKARYLQELYLTNPNGFKTEIEAENYWKRFSEERAAFKKLN